MATSNDHPGLRFVQAKGYTRGRPDGPPLWIVWHDMEVDELPDRAENTAGYFANPGDGRDVSSHLCVDSNSVVQCVDEDDSAWCVGNRPGNYRGINVELAGRATQTRAQWLDSYGQAMFATVAPIIARSMQRWKIPNRWCTHADLLARRPGHTTHNDLGIAFGGSDHTDPGKGFPRDHVLAVVAAALGGDDMPLTDADLAKVRSVAASAFADALKTPAAKDLLADILRDALPGLLRRDTDGSYMMWRIEALAKQREKIVVPRPDGTTTTETNKLAETLHGLEAAAAGDRIRDELALAAIKALGAALSTGGKSVDTAAIIATIQAEGDTTRDLVTELREENTELRARLAGAPQPTADEGDAAPHRNT